MQNVRRGKRLFIANDKCISLTTMENKILSYYIKNKDKLLKDTTVTQAIWNDNNTNALAQHISRLNKKLKGILEFKRLRFYGYKIKYIGE